MDRASDREVDNAVPNIAAPTHPVPAHAAPARTADGAITAVRSPRPPTLDQSVLRALDSPTSSRVRASSAGALVGVRHDRTSSHVVRRVMTTGYGRGTKVNHNGVNGLIVSPDDAGYLVEFIGESRVVPFAELNLGHVESEEQAAQPGLPEVPQDLPVDLVDTWVREHADQLFAGREPGELGDERVRGMRIAVVIDGLRKNRQENLLGLLGKGVHGTQWRGGGVCYQASTTYPIPAAGVTYKHRSTGNTWTHAASSSGDRIYDGTWKQFFDGAAVAALPPVFDGTADQFRDFALDEASTESYLDMFRMGRGDRPVDHGRVKAGGEGKRGLIENAMADWLGYDESDASGDDSDDSDDSHAKTRAAYLAERLPPETQRANAAWVRLESQLKSALPESTYKKAFEAVKVVPRWDDPTALRFIAVSADAAANIRKLLPKILELLQRGDEGWKTVVVEPN